MYTDENNKNNKKNLPPPSTPITVFTITEKLLPLWLSVCFYYMFGEKLNVAAWVD